MIITITAAFNIQCLLTKLIAIAFCSIILSVNLHILQELTYLVNYSAWISNSIFLKNKNCKVCSHFLFKTIFADTTNINNENLNSNALLL